MSVETAIYHVNIRHERLTVYQVTTQGHHSDQRSLIANLGHWTLRIDRLLFGQHVILNVPKCLFFYAVWSH